MQESQQTIARMESENARLREFLKNNNMLEEEARVPVPQPPTLDVDALDAGLEALDEAEAEAEAEADYVEEDDGNGSENSSDGSGNGSSNYGKTSCEARWVRLSPAPLGPAHVPSPPTTTSASMHHHSSSPPTPPPLSFG